MNAYIRSSLLKVFVAAAVLSLAATSTSRAQGPPWAPGPGINCDAPAASFQRHIDNAPAGSTLLPYGSCHDGPYFIDKDIKINGSFWGADKPARFSAASGSNHVLHIRGASVKIDDVHVDASGAAHGILVEGSSLTAERVVVTNASPGNGIHLSGSSLYAGNVGVRNCSGSGIHVGLTSFAQITNSELENNGVGVFITEASSGTLGKNIIKGSTLQGVLVIAASSAYIVDTDLISGGGGLAVDRLSNASLFKSRVQGNTGAGVWISPWYSLLSLRGEVNTIQGNNPDVSCHDRGILEVAAPQISSTKTSFIAPSLSTTQLGCTVTSLPIFAP